jgi:hypothetical protein
MASGAGSRVIPDALIPVTMNANGAMAGLSCDPLALDSVDVRPVNPCRRH